ncbi:MAG: FG-GAP-like repeat-containing protein, partial [bacterium]
MNCPQILYPNFTRKRRILFARFLETRALYLLCPIVVLALFTWFAISVSQASSGTPSFTAATNFPAGTNPHAVGVGDFNGDNKADLAVANSGSGNISILLGDGAGGFGTATNFPAGLTPVSIAIGDFNGDSKLDLAVANNGDVSHAGDVSILLGDGAGNFSAPTSLTAGVHPYAVVAADLNGDSKLDLAVANYDSSNASLSLGNGLGAFGAVTNFTVGTNPRALVVGDFNKDSKIDLAVANQGSNNVSLLLGDGAGSLAGAVNFGVGTGPVSVATGDLNGDAKPDLIIANFTSGNVSVLLGDGLGGFAGATNFTAGSSPYSVVIADFYGDGKSDIAVANSGAANVSLLLGDGAGSLGTPTNFPVATDPRILATGNFNADSKPDLAVPNFGANNVSLLLNSSMVTATISGTVKDTQNTPIAGATIEAINSSSQLVVATSISDANGHYILTVPLGTYDLKTTPPTGSNFRGVTIPNRSIVGDLVQDITLVPPDFLQLSGRIVDRDGQAMPNVEVQL